MKSKPRKKSWKKAVAKISPLRKPDDLSVDAWQIGLRKQVAGEAGLRVRNVGDHPIFSTFEVKNQKSQKSYRVVLRGETAGVNYCSCPDFALNTLGTCKHIESVLRRVRRVKGAREALKAGFVSDHSSLTLRYGQVRRVSFSLGRLAGDELKKLVGEYFDAQGCLTERGFREFDQFMSRVRGLGRDVRYHDDALAFVAKVRDVDQRKKRVADLIGQGIQNISWKNLIKADLYDYQKEGALFAANAGRSLIADEMGLGKTVQAITAAEIMARALGVEKVLIVCPSSLKFQWKQEIERWTGRQAQVIGGLLHRRGVQYLEPSFFKIINYDVVHQDLAEIGKWSPDLVILDEAQRIKNWKTRLAKSVKQLSTPYAIVLTGTPLENRLEELHSILGFIDQHHLGPLFRFLERHQIRDEDGKVTGYRELQGLNKTLDTVLIRRTRKEVLPQLPSRMDKNYFVPMTPEQTDIHNEHKEIVAKLVQKWRRFHFLSDEDHQRLMMALQTMRMVCDNTYLVDKKSLKGKKIDELEIQLREIFEDPQSKVVIFSQWLRMGELVGAMLDVNAWKFVTLHGGIPSPKRGDIIRAFQEDPTCRVFLSTDAGGTGLNLQHASIVINLDLPWNPAVLEQRISRVYRMGQERAVRVINFISEGTIEHGMLEVHRFKRSLFAGALDGTSDEVFMGGSRMNNFMKTVEEASGAVPQVDQAQDVKIQAPGIPDAAQLETLLEGPALNPSLNPKKIRTGLSPRVVAAPLETEKEASPQQDPIKGVLQAGVSFLSNLLEGLQKQEGHPEGPVKIEKNPVTGKRTLHLPLPDDAMMEKFTQAASLLAELLKR